jgi:hypothetical protein
MSKLRSPPPPRLDPDGGDFPPEMERARQKQGLEDDDAAASHNKSPGFVQTPDIHIHALR